MICKNYKPKNLLCAALIADNSVDQRYEIKQHIMSYASYVNELQNKNLF